MSDKKPDPFVERMERILQVLDRLPEDKRFQGLEEMAKISQAIPASDTDTKVEGEGHTVITFNNVGGNNDVTFGSGGWSSKKRSNSTKSGKFKVQSSGPYLGREWVPVYESVRAIQGFWNADSSDGNLLPEHKGREWDGKGKSLGLQLGEGVLCPEGYWEVSQDELRHISGPQGTRLALRKQVYDKALQLKLIVKAAELVNPDASPDASDTTKKTDDTSSTTGNYFT